MILLENYNVFENFSKRKKLHLRMKIPTIWDQEQFSTVKACRVVTNFLCECSVQAALSSPTDGTTFPANTVHFLPLLHPLDKNQKRDYGRRFLYTQVHLVPGLDFKHWWADWDLTASAGQETSSYRLSMNINTSTSKSNNFYRFAILVHLSEDTFLIELKEILFF